MSPNDRQLGIGSSCQTQSNDIVDDTTGLLAQGLLFMYLIEDTILCTALRSCAVKRFMVNCRVYDCLVLCAILKSCGYNVTLRYFWHACYSFAVYPCCALVIQITPVAMSSCVDQNRINRAQCKLQIVSKCSQCQQHINYT